jgi:WD40 repeat protein
VQTGRNICGSISLVCELLLSVSATSSRTPQPVVQTGHADPVFSVAFSPDEQLLASTGSDESVGLWELSTNSRLRTFGGFSLHLADYQLRGTSVGYCLGGICADGRRAGEYSGSHGGHAGHGKAAGGRHERTGSQKQNKKETEFPKQGKTRCR